MIKRDIIQNLESAGIETAVYEAKIILEDVAPENIPDVVARRMRGEPLWRILGYRDFWKHRFYLSPETLEPRPDTETLIEAALEIFKNNPPKKILDLGTGTGCILLSLLHEFPDAIGVGVDIQAGACHTAKQNAETIGLSNRAEFIVSNWTESLDGKFDLIVSNPPYIPRDEIRNLQKEVRNHDPILALDGGYDGLDPYKILLSNLKNHLEPEGVVLFEVGQGQVSDISRIAVTYGATLSRVYTDLGGVDRVVKISYGDN